MPFILSIDVGTGSLKAGLMNTDDGSWTIAGRPLTTHFDGDRAEQDANEYVAAMMSVVAELRQRCRDITDLRAIGVTGQMRGLVLAGQDHQPLGPVLTLHDRRAPAEAQEFISEFGIAHIHQLTGQRFDVASTPAKLRRLAASEPERLRDAWKLLAPKDYIRLRLTGTPATDPTDAAGWLLYDLEHEQWHADLVRFSGIRPDQLPEIRPACSAAGPLLPEWRDAWGLRGDVPVFVGAGDDIAATGCGAVEPGDIYEHIGSTGSIFAVTDRIILDERQIIECYPTETPGRYWVGGSCNGAGTAIEHGLKLSSLTHEGRIDWTAVHHALSRWAEKPPQSRPLFLPYVAGERCPLWDSRVRGAMIGLSIDHTPDDIAVAIHDGPALLLAWIMQEVQRIVIPQHVRHGESRLWRTGGQIHSAGKAGQCESFGQLRATVYGQRVHRAAHVDAALLGAALIAGVGCDLWPDTPSGAKRFLQNAWTADPLPIHAAAYQERLEQFQAISELLAKAAH